MLITTIAFVFFTFAIWPLPLWRFLLALGAVLILSTIRKGG